MSKQIKLQLNSKSISAAIQEIEKYKAWVKEKTALLTEKLAILGAHEASIRFGSAYYDGEDGGVSVEVSPIANGWKITASGTAVAFIEFGAGVFYNGAEPYPVARPPGVAKIGEYGQGKGKQDSWGYYNSAGELVISHGTPAAMPMYHASREIQQELVKIAREVFAN